MTESLKKVYFHHIPKTAGTSLRSYLADQYLQQSISRSTAWSDLSLSDLRELNNFNLVMGHYDTRIVSHLNADFKLITFLRDPVERTISAINHAISDSVFRPEGLHGQLLSLEEIVFNPEAMGYFTNTQVASLTGSDSIEELIQKYDPANCAKGHPSSDDLIADYDLAVANLEKFDFIGITAFVDDEVLRLADRYSFFPPHKAPSLNVADKGAMAVISNDIIEEVKKYNLLDIKLYNYVLERKRNTGLNTRSSSLVKYFHAKEKIVSGTFLSLESPFPGSGFYEAEANANRELYRWSGPGTESRIAFNLVPNSEYRIIISCFFLHHASGNHLNILKDNNTVASIVVPEGLVRAEFNIVSSAVNEGVTELIFSFNEIRLPASDRRPLGFMLCSLYITPFF